MSEKPSSYPLRLPASLKQEAAELARLDGTTLNQFIALALAEKVGRTKAVQEMAADTKKADHGTDRKGQGETDVTRDQTPG